MAIEWYPGHMVTARKNIAEAMGKIDVVIEVLDARVPRASCNPLLETLRLKNAKPALKLLNKADVADPERTKQWLAYYNAQPGTRALALSATKAGEVARIPKECQALAVSSPSRARPLHLMILGIPNVGKSTMMNTLLKRHVANVGDEPAITKKHMRHELDNGMWLTDTPGMMWPGITENSAIHLAASHSIGRRAYDDEEVAAFLGMTLLALYRPLLVKRYGELAPDIDGLGLIAHIAKRRSLVLKGGVPDLAKAALVFLTEFRNGTLGRITLETV